MNGSHVAVSVVCVESGTSPKSIETLARETVATRQGPELGRCVSITQCPEPDNASWDVKFEAVPPE